MLRLRDCKGLRYLALLLAHPGERFAADELMRRIGDAGTREDIDCERARAAVSKRIRAAIGKIQQYHPTFGYLLHTTIKTGYRCAYLPGPEGPSG